MSSAPAHLQEAHQPDTESRARNGLCYSGTDVCVPAGDGLGWGQFGAVGPAREEPGCDPDAAP